MVCLRWKIFSSELTNEDKFSRVTAKGPNFLIRFYRLQSRLSFLKFIIWAVYPFSMVSLLRGPTVYSWEPNQGSIVADD